MKRFNFNELLWFIILAFLDVSMIYLVYTDKIKFYIGINIIKYIYITIVMISLITIFQIKNIFTSKGSSSIKLKLCPIILAMILGMISINNMGTFKHDELNKDIRENKTNKIERRSLYEHEFDYNLNKNKSNIKSEYESNSNKDITQNSKKEKIIVDDKNPMILDDIRTNPAKYIGKKLEIHGFVCKENYLNKNQFIIGRIVMTCCAADSKVVGIVGEYNNIDNLNESENICVVGIISSSMIRDENHVNHSIPVIKIETLEVEK